MENKSSSYVIYGAYYLTLAAILAASFFPEYRVWGFNWWAYYPDWVRWTLFGLGAVTPLITKLGLRWVDSGGGDNEVVQKNGRYLFVTAVLMAILGGLFYFLRARAHFLGDGYQLLSRLAQEAPNLKMWDVGTSLLNSTLFSLLTGAPDVRALMTFQIIAVVSGLLLIAGVAWLARILFEKNTERILFLLGLASSGYMLLYFGYVENYAPLMAGITLYALIGLASSQGKLSRLWAIGLFVLVATLHLFALALLPSLIYLLLKDTSLGQRFGTVRRRNWYLAAGILTVISMLAYYYLYSNYYFFTFALMPLFPDQFTIENDWLFSLKHFTDLANLFLLMLPGLPLLVTAVIVGSVKLQLRSQAARFLMLLVISTAGVVFVFNPGIGMPRNWDLFSLVGPPLAVAAYYLIIKSRQSVSDYRSVCVLSIVLGALILIPRAVSLAIPEFGVSHYENYLRMDKLRSRAGYTFLIKYYNDIGDRVKAELARSYWDDQYPQRDLLTRCQQEYAQGNAEAAFRLCTKATEIDPVFYIPYFQLGSMYLDQEKPDSALAMFNIARGLNPYGADIVLGQAMAYAQTGDMGRAEKAWITVTEWTDEIIDAHLFLMDIYKARSDLQKYHRHLLVAGISDDAPARVLQELGDYFLAKADLAQAADAYRRAMEKGLDSVYVRQMIQQYPQLGQHLK